MLVDRREVLVSYDYAMNYFSDKCINTLVDKRYVLVTTEEIKCHVPNDLSGPSWPWGMVDSKTCLRLYY